MTHGEWHRRRAMAGPLVLALAVSVGCFEVDDYGAYWDKGSVDDALVGVWTKVEKPGANPEFDDGDFASFHPRRLWIEQGEGSLRLRVSNDLREETPGDDFGLLRTLRVGRQRHWMLKQPDPAVKGMFGFPYRVRRGRLQLLANEKVLQSWESRPLPREFVRRESGPMRILYFDVEIFDWFEEDSRSDRGWQPFVEYRKGR